MQFLNSFECENGEIHTLVKCGIASKYCGILVLHRNSMNKNTYSYHITAVWTKENQVVCHKMADFTNMGAAIISFTQRLSYWTYPPPEYIVAKGNLYDDLPF